MISQKCVVLFHYEMCYAVNIFFTGYVCSRTDILSSGCCNTDSETTKRYSCETCKENGCCSIYEYCISCCLHPDKVSMKKRYCNCRHQYSLLVCNHIDTASLWFGSISKKFCHCRLTSDVLKSQTFQSYICACHYVIFSTFCFLFLDSQDIKLCSPKTMVQLH